MLAADRAGSEPTFSASTWTLAPVPVAAGFSVPVRVTRAPRRRRPRRTEARDAVIVAGVIAPAGTSAAGTVTSLLPESAPSTAVGSL